MIDTGAVLAICAAATVIGGTFLWIVGMIVQKAVRDGINGFAIEIALIKQRQSEIDRHLTDVDIYAHTGVAMGRARKEES